MFPSGSPSRLSAVPLVPNNATICNRSVATTHLVGDSASSAEFFVGVATVCFLYSMVALLVYLGYMHVYKDSDFGPMFVSVIHLSVCLFLPSRPKAWLLLTQFSFLTTRTLRWRPSWSFCGWYAPQPGPRGCRTWRTPRALMALSPRWRCARPAMWPARSPTTPICVHLTSLWWGKGRKKVMDENGTEIAKRNKKQFRRNVSVVNSGITS